MPALVLKLLGGFEASVEDGAAMPLSSKTGQALLAFLALPPDRRHSRDKLATLLWEDRPDDQARASLRQTLAVLRRAFPTGSLRTEADWIVLDPDACWIDVTEFERLAARNDAASLHDAAMLYKGALLDGFHLRSDGFAGWLRGERERLQGRALQVLRSLLALQSPAEDKVPAIATAGRLLALDPADEATHRALMRLHAADGRTDAALRQYQLCREQLRRELDVAPQPETEALYQDLLQGRAGPAAAESKEDASRQAPIKSDVPSIVVLPFVNQSGDPREAHIGDGITEDIIIELSRYRSLLVIARSSAFQFRGMAADIAAIRQRLGVRYVVEGSLRKIGPQLRISAQLVDSESESTLWADRYDRSQDEIFELQNQVASAIASTLEGRIVARGVERVRRKPTKEWDAYDHYLQGRELMHRYRTPEAVPHLTRAIAIDPAYGQAYALRSLAIANSYVIGGCTEPEKLAAGLADAQHALALDDEDGSSHEAMGYALLWSDRKEEAGKHFDRALALNPTDVDITCDRANWLLCVGRLEEALGQLDAAMRRDPFLPVWAWEVRGSVMYRLGRYEEALAAFQKVDTDFYWLPAFIAASCGQLGRSAEAKRALAEFHKLKPNMTISTIDGLFPYVGEDWLAHLIDGLRKAGFPE